MPIGPINPGGGGGAVSSVFTRTGAVVAASGDYTPAQVGSLPTGTTVTFRQAHSYSVSGLLAVPSGATNFLPPFNIPISASETVTLAGVMASIRGGTSVTVEIQQNGSNVSGLGALVVTTTPGFTAATVPPSVANDDSFAIIVTAISAIPDGLSLTFYFDVTLTL